MGNLKQQGYRFMVHTKAKQAFWCHPQSVITECQGDGWIDCTDMGDAEFDALLAEVRK
ncbi:hypothetical protein [Massilia sp. TS11]|uniref:hypothetical protein n=1 Tax=Massilia sp. TS11 TaxID=2908003 RepID=UPI001EDC4CC4|nr:hypothetical protein [Massilia sp. TS11]MCG2586532.1 hypothetical protein [Massilia sp. TS11]